MLFVPSHSLGICDKHSLVALICYHWMVNHCSFPKHFLHCCPSIFFLFIPVSNIQGKRHACFDTILWSSLEKATIFHWVQYWYTISEHKIPTVLLLDYKNELVIKFCSSNFSHWSLTIRSYQIQWQTVVLQKAENFYWLRRPDKNVHRRNTGKWPKKEHALRNRAKEMYSPKNIVSM